MKSRVTLMITAYFLHNDLLFKLELDIDVRLAKLREEIKRFDALKQLDFNFFYKCQILTKTIFRIDDDFDLSEAIEEMMTGGTIFFLISVCKIKFIFTL